MKLPCYRNTVFYGFRLFLLFYKFLHTCSNDDFSTISIEARLLRNEYAKF